MPIIAKSLKRKVNLGARQVVWKTEPSFFVLLWQKFLYKD